MPAADLPGEIVRLSPSEVIAADRLLADERRAASGSASPARRPRRCAGASFDSLAGERLLKARLGVADLGGLRQLLARGAGGRRRAAQVRRADADRQDAVPASAAPRRARQPPRHRCGEPRQPGAAARALGRAAGQPARRHRPHRRPAPARASWPRGCRARCATRTRSPRGSTRSASCVEDETLRDDLRAHAARRRPTSRAPCRASPCSAAARAISAPCATGWRPLPRARACCATAPAASACRRRCAASPGAWRGCGSDLADLLAARWSTSRRI